LRCVRVGSGDTKLFNRVRADAQHRAERVAGLLLVNVNTVQRNVRLVTATTRHVSRRSHRGLQTQKVRDVSGVEWKLGDLLGDEVISQAPVLCIDERLTCADRNRNCLGEIAYLHRDVEVHWFRDQRIHVSQRRFLEAFRFNVDLVDARLNSFKSKLPALVRRGVATTVGFRVRQGHSSAGHYASLRVLDSAADCGQALALSEGASANEH